MNLPVIASWIVRFPRFWRLFGGVKKGEASERAQYSLKWEFSSDLRVDRAN